MPDTSGPSRWIGEKDRHGDVIRVGELTIDPPRHRVTVGGREIHLTRKEFALLYALATDPHRVFGKDELKRMIWGQDIPAGKSRTLDSHASRLRLKLDADDKTYIVNCWGIGYRLVEPDLGDVDPVVTITKVDP